MALLLVAIAHVYLLVSYYDKKLLQISWTFYDLPVPVHIYLMNNITTSETLTANKIKVKN
jgi:hypothetical protein